MTTAMMITDSLESLNDINLTRQIISFVLSTIDQDFIDCNGTIITKDEIQKLASTYEFMYEFLSNPIFSLNQSSQQIIDCIL
jgi:hypothetical protein